MRLLLDTQVYLWMLQQSPRLSAAAKALIVEAVESEEVFVSAASIWEACIKIGNRKLKADPQELVTLVEPSGLKHLPVRAEHSSLVAKLPYHHRDPFDRLLIAQSSFESLRFVTADAILRVYSPLVYVIE